MARPAKLSPELTREIMAYIQDGNSPTKSATLVGIAPSTYFNWMSKGSNQEPRFMEFSESIKRACAQSIANRLAHISRAADSGNWRSDYNQDSFHAVHFRTLLCLYLSPIGPP